MVFPEKKKEIKKPALFGSWKHGDPLHTGYNKCLGGHGRTTEDAYVEEEEEDPIMYQKNVSKPIWRDPTNGKTMMNTSTHNNFRNINKERTQAFGR